MSIVGPISKFPIPDDGVEDVLEVPSDLILPTGFGCDFDERIARCLVSPNGGIQFAFLLRAIG